MAIPKIVAVASAAATAASGLMAARSFAQAAQTEEQAGLYNRQVAQRDAIIKEQEARQIRHAADLERIENEQNFQEFLGATKLSFAHNGWMLGGTPALSLAYSADQFYRDQQRLDHGARTQERAKLEAAEADKTRGELEMAMARNRAARYRGQAGQSLLGAAGSRGRIYFGR